MKQKVSKTNTNLLKVYAIVFVLTALGTFTTFYLTRIPDLVYYFLFLITGCIVYLQKPTINNQWTSPLIYLFMCSFYIAIDGASLFPFIAFVFYSILFLLGYDEKRILFDISNRLIALFILFSMVFWIIHLLGVNLPYTAIEYQGRDLFNYRYFLKSSYIFSDYRFQGLFAEPGHLGLVCSLLLFPCNYNLKKKETWVYLVAIILSLSLAAYILTIIGFFLYNISKRRLGRKAILIILSVFVLVILGYKYAHNNQDSLLYSDIFYRLEYSDGKLVGNNRYSDDFDSYYNVKMSDTKVALFGLGQDFDTADFPKNSGYKIFIIQYGWVGFLLLFLFYLSLARSYHSKISYALLVLYTISFIQRPYMWSVLEIGLFVISLSVINSNSSTLKKEL